MTPLSDESLSQIFGSLPVIEWRCLFKLQYPVRTLSNVLDKFLVQIFSAGFCLLHCVEGSTISYWSRILSGSELATSIIVYFVHFLAVPTDLINSFSGAVRLPLANSSKELKLHISTYLYMRRLWIRSKRWIWHFGLWNRRNQLKRSNDVDFFPYDKGRIKNTLFIDHELTYASASI